MAPRDTLVRISKLLVLSYLIDWVFIVYVDFVTCNAVPQKKLISMNI